jgi:hypothetical protein
MTKPIESASAWNPTKTELFKIKINNAKNDLKMFFYKWFWKTLFFFRVARPVSIMLCKLNLYPKYVFSNRCQWCGNIHGGIL